MATLEKIRAKQGLLFTVIIVALFLFILTLAGNPFESCTRGQGDGPVMEAGNVSVNYSEFDKYRQPYNQNAEGVDKDYMNSALLRQMFTERLFQKECEELGIGVADKQMGTIIDMLPMTSPISNLVGQLSRALGLTTPNAGQIVAIINNPQSINLTKEQLDDFARQQYGFASMQELWKFIEDNAELEFQKGIYFGLLDGLYTANDLDAKCAHHDSFSQRTVSYVAIPLSSDPTEYNVSDSDVKAQYDGVKNDYKIDQETRLVEYIMVPITPSAEDFAAAAEIVKQNRDALANNTGGASGMGLIQGTTTLETLAMNPMLRIDADSVAEGEVIMMPQTGDSFTLVRLAKIYPQVESINISGYMAQSKEEADSIVNGLNAGTITFADLIASNPQMAATGMAADSIDTPLLQTNPNSRETNMWKRTLVNVTNEGREAFNELVNNFDAGKRGVTVDTIPVQEGVNYYSIRRVNSHGAPVKMVDVEVYTLDVVPSTNTVNKLRGTLTNFVATNSTSDKFSAAADTLTGYNKYTALVDASNVHFNDKMVNVENGVIMPAGGGALNDSRDIVKWVMTSDKGDVSSVFDHTQYLVVATVKDIYKDQFIPYNSPVVYNRLKNLAINDKKGAAIAAKYKASASNLNTLAEASHSTVLNQQGFSLTTPYLGRLNSYNLLGKVATATPKLIYGPIVADNSVVYFTVDEEKAPTRELKVEDDGKRFVSNFGFNVASQPEVLLNLLLGTRKLENKLLDFEYNNR